VVSLLRGQAAEIRGRRSKNGVGGNRGSRSITTLTHVRTSAIAATGGRSRRSGGDFEMSILRERPRRVPEGKRDLSVSRFGRQYQARRRFTSAVPPVAG
jgi:hypothetical protein